MKKKVLFTILALVLVLGVFQNRSKLKSIWLDLTKEKVPVAVEYTPDEQADKTTDPIPTSTLPKNKVDLPTTTTTAKPTTTPTAYNLAVPFTTQAPFGNWNEPFEDACEEASALMVDYYYQHKTFTQQIAKDEILKMIDWEVKYFGVNKNLTAEEAAAILKNYLGYKKVVVIQNPTIADIKQEILAKHPVILPAAGRLLANPYFKSPGPIYHMLVIKGFTNDKFITNDPGTNTKGKDFMYVYDNLMKSMHSWNEQDILQGDKKIIVVYPN